ncbi:hairy/enhancer-of-split related with YRPW motif protein 2-like [Mercenaria mercenaria]|uniref:hairy/enhancer-of-split related with YRPW motif protein 2-like n=1 Tax=Mercenaria mercenaria TaxID=6596 RepID=UPI00234EDA33|nr:hairy/enhancer-of-split related with YRPW motif protein 2-like [Mercenaria mercenaria]
MLSEKPRGGLSETRKMTKSTMEKKRRARINNSLTELKAILSGMISNKGERFDKMEKADILEMTVKCVRQLQKQANTGDSVRTPSSSVDEDYRSGMHTCMSEVIKFISSSHFSDADPEVKTKLLNHLANKLNSGTTHERNTDPDTSYAYQKEISENNCFMPNMTNTDTDSLSISDMSNDSNNNLQTISDKNTPFSVNVRNPKSPPPTPLMASPLLTSYKPIQPVQETLQPPSSVPTVPLTILVPANICSATLGTTCVIPLNLPTGSPQLSQAANFFQTVSQPSQTSFTINSNSGISLIQTPNVVQNTQLSSKVNELSNLSPQNKFYTFTPTVLSNCNRTQNGSYTTKETVKPATVPFTTMLSPQDRSEGSTIPNLNHKTDATKEPVANYQIIAQPNEFSIPQITEFPRMVTDSNKSVALNYPFNESRTDIVNEIVRDKVYQRKVDQHNLREKDRPIHYEQGQFSGISKSAAERLEERSVMYNRQPGNGCDDASDMWRPWKTAI